MRTTSGTPLSSVYDTTASGVITGTRLNLRVECNVDNVSFALNPWRAKASRGTMVRFNLTGVASAQIHAKDATKWPFKDASPLRIGSGSPTGYAIRADADTTTYSYAIHFDCGTAGGPVTIDPDIIIVDAM